jgi:hypothetical protein
MRQQKRAQMIRRKHDLHTVGGERGLLQAVIEIGCVVDQHVQPRIVARKLGRE